MMTETIKHSSSYSYPDLLTGREWKGLPECRDGTIMLTKTTSLKGSGGGDVRASSSCDLRSPILPVTSTGTR